MGRFETTEKVPKISGEDRRTVLLSYGDRGTVSVW